MEKILKVIKELKSPYEIGLELIEIEQQIEKLYKKHEELAILKNK